MCELSYNKCYGMNLTTTLLILPLIRSYELLYPVAETDRSIDMSNQFRKNDPQVCPASPSPTCVYLLSMLSLQARLPFVAPL